MDSACKISPPAPAAAALRLYERKAKWETEHEGHSVRRRFVCALLDKGGACSDYRALLTFMHLQERQRNRSVAPLCMTSLVGSTGSRYSGGRSAVAVG